MDDQVDSTSVGSLNDQADISNAESMNSWKNDGKPGTSNGSRSPASYLFAAHLKTAKNIDIHGATDNR